MRLRISSVMCALSLLVLFSLSSLTVSADQQPGTIAGQAVQDIINGVRYDNIVLDDLTVFPVPIDLFGNPIPNYTFTPDVAGEYLDHILVPNPADQGFTGDPGIGSAPSYLPMFIYSVYENTGSFFNPFDPVPGPNTSNVQNRQGGFIRLMICNTLQCGPDERWPVDITLDNAPFGSPDGILDDLYDVAMDYNAEGRPVIAFRNQSLAGIGVMTCASNPATIAAISAEAFSPSQAARIRAADVCGTIKGPDYFAAGSNPDIAFGLTPDIIVGQMNVPGVVGLREAALVAYQIETLPGLPPTPPSLRVQLCRLNTGTSTPPDCLVSGNQTLLRTMVADFRPFFDITFSNYNSDTDTVAVLTYVEGEPESTGDPATDPANFRFRLARNIDTGVSGGGTSSDLYIDGPAVDPGAESRPPFRAGFFSDIETTQLGAPDVDDELIMAYRALRGMDDNAYSGTALFDDALVLAGSARGLFVATCTSSPPYGGCNQGTGLSTDVTRRLVTPGVGGGAGAGSSIEFDYVTGLPIISFFNAVTKDLNVVYCTNASCDGTLTGDIFGEGLDNNTTDAFGAAVPNDGEVILVSHQEDDLGRLARLELIPVETNSGTATGFVIPHFNDRQNRVELYRPEGLDQTTMVGDPVIVDLNVSELDQTPGLNAGEFFNLDVNFQGNAQGLRLSYDTGMLNATALRPDAATANATLDQAAGAIDGLSSASSATIRMQVVNAGASVIHVVDANGNVVGSLTVAATSLPSLPVAPRGGADAPAAAEPQTPTAPLPVGDR